MNQLKKLTYISTLNISFFLILMIGIQNSSKKSRVNLIFNETVDLPVSFIIGTSFVGGSITASVLTLFKKNKKV